MSNVNQSATTTPTPATAALDAMTPEQRATIMSALQSISSADIVRMVQEKAAEEARVAAAIVEKQTALFVETVKDVNEMLRECAENLAIGGRSIVLEFVPESLVAATETNDAITVPAHYQIVELKSKGNVRTLRTGQATRVVSHAALSAPTIRVVDGKEYSSFKAAFDTLGYEWNGSNPSFNARLELMRLGHEVSGATR